MPIFYAIIARGATVLAKYASCAGNFQEIAEHILSKITSDEGKMTYTQPGYLFHYIAEGGITFLCITDDVFERLKAFIFLAEVQKRFVKTYGNRALTALPYAMQSEFSRVLAAEMRHYSDPLVSKPDNMKKIEEEIEQIKGIMLTNIESVSKRGENLELLVNKADTLNAKSLTFKKTSKGLARAMFMKNLKMIIIIGLVVFILILIIVFASCGTDWSSCGKGSSKKS